MQEPAYILKNGQSVPYIPTTITTNRDAYAASLHVLFKHVADFHICVVKVFSAKYGIPEDDILQTIQESDEFKNMHVDPVLDPLGYLDGPVVTEVTSTKEELAVPAPAQPTKVKKSKKSEPIVNPIQTKIVAEPTTNPNPTPTPTPNPNPTPTPMHVEERERESGQELVKPKIIRKKMVTTAPTTAPTTTTVPTTAPETNAPRKIIKKKVST